MTERRVQPRRRGAAVAASTVGVYVVVLLVLQIFLLTVALEAFHGYDAALAWIAAAVSAVLTAAVVIVERLMGRR